MARERSVKRDLRGFEALLAVYGRVRKRFIRCSGEI